MANTFPFIYSETKKQVLAIILLPLAFTALFVVCLFEFHWLEFPVWINTLGFIAVLAGSMLYVMNRLVNITAVATVTDDSVSIELNKTNFLYHTKCLSVPLDNIVKFSEDINTQTSRSYFNITLAHPSKTILLMQPKGMEEATLKAFSEMMQGNIDAFNSNPPIPGAAKISSGSFYDAGWARALTFITYIALIAVTVAVIAGAGIEWYKILQVYAFGLSWLIAYHTNVKKKRA